MKINIIADSITNTLRFFAIPWIIPASAAVARIIANAMHYLSFFATKSTAYYYLGLLFIFDNSPNAAPPIISTVPII